jgi:hypothetical protein
MFKAGFKSLLKPFWHWLFRFAFRRYMAGTPRTDLPDGIPLLRDPEGPCTFYEPRRRELGDFSDCQGDGHYLCRECCHHVDHLTNGRIYPVRIRRRRGGRYA